MSECEERKATFGDCQTAKNSGLDSQFPRSDDKYVPSL